MNQHTLWTHLVMILAALLLGGSTATGCWDDDFHSDPECEGQPPEDIEGTWTIRASGQRSLCTEDELNTGDLSMQSMPLEICQDYPALDRQEVVEPGATVRWPVPAQTALVLKVGPAPSQTND